MSPTSGLKRRANSNFVEHLNNSAQEPDRLATADRKQPTSLHERKQHQGVPDYLAFCALLSTYTALKTTLSVIDRQKQRCWSNCFQSSDSNDHPSKKGIMRLALQSLISNSLQSHSLARFVNGDKPSRSTKASSQVHAQQRCEEQRVPELSCIFSPFAFKKLGPENSASVNTCGLVAKRSWIGEIFDVNWVVAQLNTGISPQAHSPAHPRTRASSPASTLRGKSQPPFRGIWDPTVLSEYIGCTMGAPLCFGIFISAPTLQNAPVAILQFDEQL